MFRIAACTVLLAGAGAAVTGPEQAAFDRISADSLRGNLSFLASDALEGRFTPSQGLDTAAEFIAAQFRRAGLEPIGKDHSYFQQADLTEFTPNPKDERLTLRAGDEELDLNPAEMEVRTRVGLDLSNAPVFELPETGTLPNIAGKIVAGSNRVFGNEAAVFRLQAGKPKLILLVGRRAGLPAGPTFLDERGSVDAPVVRITSGAAADALSERRLRAISLHVAAPQKKDVTARNVGAVLQGSDPVLKNQYVFLTAHYDHLGKAGERVFNGANDNGSGTVSVIEIASALASLAVHPKRSIVFMTWYGEEEGLLGAFYYSHHPLFPLKDTVANINLEQLGRTDEDGGARVGEFAFTGPSYSNLPTLLSTAAKEEHVGTWVKKNADSFFDRSDNYAFALAGVVAHTVVVAFEYPDYHGLGDKWQKIDYANMARVDKGVAAGLVAVANAEQPPRWSETKATAVYRGAGK